MTQSHHLVWGMANSAPWGRFELITEVQTEMSQNNAGLCFGRFSGSAWITRWGLMVWRLLWCWYGLSCRSEYQKNNPLSSTLSGDAVRMDCGYLLPKACKPKSFWHVTRHLLKRLHKLDGLFRQSSDRFQDSWSLSISLVREAVDKSHNVSLFWTWANKYGSCFSNGSRRFFLFISYLQCCFFFVVFNASSCT